MDGGARESILDGPASCDDIRLLSNAIRRTGREPHGSKDRYATRCGTPRPIRAVLLTATSPHREQLALHHDHRPNPELARAKNEAGSCGCFFPVVGLGASLAKAFMSLRKKTCRLLFIVGAEP